MSVEVLGQDGRTWYTITESKSTGGPITGNPLRMISNRPAYLGHVYRTVATAKLVVPNGHAGCSLSNRDGGQPPAGSVTRERSS